MPCNSVTTQFIALTKAQPDILKKALADLGFNPSVVQFAGQIRVTKGSYGPSVFWKAGEGLTVTADSTSLAEAVKAGVVRAYSVAAVTWAAQWAGWVVNQVAPNKLTLNKR